MVTQDAKIQEKVDDLLSRMAALEEDRQPWESVWQEISDFCLPRRSGFSWDETTSDNLKPKSFDGTATGALQLLADGLQGYLVSHSTAWFRLQTEETAAMKYSPVREYLEEMEKVFYHLLARSNFYDAIGQAFMDGASIGTCVLYIEPDQQLDTVRFSPRHPKESFLAENRQGYVDTVYRRHQMTAREIVKAFKDIPEDFQKEAEENPYEKHKVIHAVFPREDRDVYKIDKLNKAFASLWILEDDNWLLREGGYDSFPYVVWRYRKNTDEVYGRSPAYDALTDILRSQQIGKTMLEAAQLSVNPPLNVPQEMMGRVNLTPRGMNPYTDPQKQIFPMNLGGNYPIARDREQAIQQAIKEHFRVDFFLMLNQLAGQKMTATQVMEMQSEKAAVLGTIVGRINSELLDPLFDRVFEIAGEQGWLPPVPPELQQMAGMELDIDYIGPLAQAQKRFHATQGIQQALQQVVPLLEIFPEMRDHIDPDELGRQILVKQGMPEKIIRDGKVIQKIREAQAQQAQMEQQAQIEQLGAENYQKMKDAPQGGSPAAEMLEQAKQQTMGHLLGGGGGQ